MSIQLIATLFAAATAVCLATGIWLSLHLTALTAMFHGKADIVAAPRRPRASRGTVIAMLTMFGLSLTAVLALQVVASTA